VQIYVHFFDCKVKKWKNLKLFCLLLETRELCRFDVKMRVYLIGYMGVGKTTNGRKIASRLGLNFIDLDAYVANQEGESVADIIRSRGEEEFRNLERKYLNSLSQKTNVVVATGGGTPCFFDNLEIMNASGITVYLRLAPEIIKERVKKRLETRPLLQGQTDEELVQFIRQHLDQRIRFYEQAHITVDMDRWNARKLNDLISVIIRKI
jgi:shikimate kinase